MKIIMLGAPGAGKGTQAKKIAAKYEIPHISTGDIFRANIKEGTELGKKAKTYMDQGLLVPDELVVDLVVDRVNQEDCKNGYVLDGFPRTIPQAEALDKALAELGQKMDYAIDVDVPDENIIHRMGGRRACVGCGATYHLEYAPTKVEGICDVCGKELILRDDDKPETVKKRLDVLGVSYTVNPLIVRGLDYYTKTVFEFVTDFIGAQGTVCGGGRYDGLIEELGGKHLPSLGFAMGIERLLMLMDKQGIEIPKPSTCDLYVAVMGESASLKSFEIIKAVRSCGLIAETDIVGRGLRAQMKYADKIGAKFSMVLGDNEIEQGKAVIKNMSSGEQTEIVLDDTFAEKFMVLQLADVDSFKL